MMVVSVGVSIRPSVSLIGSLCPRPINVVEKEELCITPGDEPSFETRPKEKTL